MKKAPDTMAKAAAPSAPDKRNFTARLWDAVNDSACKFVTRIVGDDLNKLFDLAMVTGFCAGAAFALVLLGVLQ